MNHFKKTGEEYEVRLELFEGPLDLLLYVVTKSEVPIHDISVSLINRQYLEYLDMMHDFNIIVASEYLNMAATLLRLKANELLPDSEPADLEDADAIIDRKQLIEKLLEYKKYKEAAGSLKIFEGEHFGCFARGKHDEVEVGSEEDGVDLGNLTFFDLVKAFRNVLERAKDEPQGNGHVVMADDVKVDDRIEAILTMVEDSEEVPFENLFMGDFRRIVLVVTFMALLELVRMRLIIFRQEDHLSSIFVKKRRDGAAALPLSEEFLSDKPPAEDLEGHGDAKEPEETNV